MNQHFSRLGLRLLLAGGMIATFATAVQAQDAAATYKAKCVACHGADGKGSAMGQKMGAHDFASADVQKETDAELAEIIGKGKGKMPKYADKLKDPEIKDLVTYIRTLGKK